MLPTMQEIENACDYAADALRRIRFEYRNKRGERTRPFGFVWRIDFDAQQTYITPTKLDLTRRRHNPDHTPARLYTIQWHRVDNVEVKGFNA